MFFVYVLYSSLAQKHYVGQTDNLQRRLVEHNDPTRSKSKFTAKYAGSWILLHYEQLPTRSEAMAREKWLKSGVGRTWIKETVDRRVPLGGAGQEPEQSPRQSSPPPVD